MKKILFADLTHTVQTIASEFMPYSVGCVAAYFKSKSNSASENLCWEKGPKSRLAKEI